MTIKAGVIGWPVDHSLSPILHGYWLDKYKIDGKYEREAIKPGELTREKLEWLRDEKGWTGLNVTVPHKETAFALANDRRQAAINAGAANLLVFKPDGSIGANNTDGTGLVDSLRQSLKSGPESLAGKNVVLLGAGGAARGAMLALHLHGVAKITVLNRHADRAKQLVAHAKEQAPNGLFYAAALDGWADAAKDAWLVINTTSAGMKGSPSLTLNLDALPKDAAVCDIVYNPLKTQFLKDAAASGRETIDGLGMLMHQAAPSFQAFFYPHLVMPPTPEVTPELRKLLEEELASRG